jgi:hypothetical protein
MRYLKIYEYFEDDGSENNNELSDDQDFDVDVEFHEFINDWEKEHAIPMTKSDLEQILAKEDLEEFLSGGGDVKEFLMNVSAKDNMLSKLIDNIKSKHEWYNDELGTSVLDKIWDLISDFEEPDSIEWSQDDEDYMTVAGEEDDDDDEIEELRQRSLKRYAQEDEDERREDEIYGRVKKGMPPTEAQKDYLQKKADKFLSKYEMKNIVKYNKFSK